MKNKENQIENFVTKYSFDKLEGTLWSEDFYNCTLTGYNFAEKEIKKQIKDLKNKFSSWLVTEQSRKVVDQEEVNKLKIKLETLQELENKLKL